MESNLVAKHVATYHLYRCPFCTGVNAVHEEVWDGIDVTSGFEIESLHCYVCGKCSYLAEPKFLEEMYGELSSPDDCYGLVEGKSMNDVLYLHLNGESIDE